MEPNYKDLFTTALTYVIQRRGCVIGLSDNYDKKIIVISTFGIIIIVAVFIIEIIVNYCVLLETIDTGV